MSSWWQERRTKFACICFPSYPKFLPCVWGLMTHPIRSTILKAIGLLGYWASLDWPWFFIFTSWWVSSFFLVLPGLVVSPDRISKSVNLESHPNLTLCLWQVSYLCPEALPLGHWGKTPPIVGTPLCSATVLKRPPETSWDIVRGVSALGINYAKSKSWHSIWSIIILIRYDTHANIIKFIRWIDHGLLASLHHWL